MKKIILLSLLFAKMLLGAVPIAEYYMDECDWNGTAGEVVDESGNYNAKVDIPGTTTTVFMGQINRSGAFNQNGVTDSAISLPPAILNGKTDFTFTVWLYLTTALQRRQTFLSAENGPNTDEDDLLFRITYNANNLNLKYDGNGNNSNSNQINFSLTANDIPVNTWTFLALTKTGNTACVAINDTGYDCQTVPEGTDPLSIQYLLLGQDSAGGATQSYYANSAFPGRMDEVKFYDTALSQSELNTIYQNEKDGKNYDGSKRIKISCVALEYRMDECYWLGNSNGIMGDVKDESPNGYNATSYNSAAITINSSSPPICNYGAFLAAQDQVSTDDTTAGNANGGAITISFWVKLNQQMEKYATILTKSKAWNWDDGWGFVNPNNIASDTLRFYMNMSFGTNVETTLKPSDGWTHIAGVYNGSSLILYKNGIEIGSSSDSNGITDSNDPIRIAFDDPKDGTLKGNVDEVKFWNRALSANEVFELYQNESNGKNYDGTDRTCPICTASVSANKWELVGIPAEFRNPNNTKTTVADIFGDDMNGTYGTDWRIYRRDYSDINNSSWYTYLASTDTLEFGKGYWLGSKIAGSWSENGALQIDYNASNPACTASQCVEIDLKSITHDFSVDGDDGTGPYRYNMTGFVGKLPVDWADCRFVIDGTVYTPSDVEAAGYAAKQIWQYNPGNGDANSNGYTTCDDTTPGGCKLEPYKGFWVQLKGPTKDKSVKLLIPKE